MKISRNPGPVVQPPSQEKGAQKLGDIKGEAVKLDGLMGDSVRSGDSFEKAGNREGIARLLGGGEPGAATRPTVQTDTFPTGAQPAGEKAGAQVRSIGTNLGLAEEPTAKGERPTVQTDTFPPGATGRD